MKPFVLTFLLFLPLIASSQKTTVSGNVLDELTGTPLPFVKIRFQDSKIGTYTDTLGKYSIDTYYATDTLIFSFSGYVIKKIIIEKDTDQEINTTLQVLQSDFDAIYIKAPDELPSTTLHKRIIANKPINDKKKLTAYEYEVYNKVQLDINNIGEKFKDRKTVKKVDVIIDYLDSLEDGTHYLPVILSESISDFYFKTNPQKKKDVENATRISGVENLDMNQFLGDMYVDVDLYSNYMYLFNKSFISPVANFARSFYKFYLEDSSFIDNQWCYKLRFTPKRTGDMTFQGDLWIHDTTYAVKKFTASIAPWVNINYVQDLYIEQEFEMVVPEVWMLKEEKMIADLKIAKKSGIYGFFGRRYSSRTNFAINAKHPDEFYKSNSTVEIDQNAKTRSETYWKEVRHTPLSKQEQGVDDMIDTLNELHFFKLLKNTMYMASTGYYPLGKVELGSVFSLVTKNQAEGWRTALSLRTSNSFSRRVELGGRIAFGFMDERLKYGTSVRYNITPKKRGMLTAFYNYDLEQIGQSPTAATIGSTFGTLLRTGPLDKLTFVQKAGINLEKDVGKDIILYGGMEWKEYTPLGIANYIRPNQISGIDDTINKIRTTELIARYRWAKDEEFVSGAFDRSSIRSKYPIISIQGIFGIKGFLNGNYAYQKIDLSIEQQLRIGFAGRIRYGINAGYIFGNAAYPFLKVHEGNESYWMQLNTFNKMNYFEFISDKYVSILVENHWDGLFLNRLPLLKKLKWRLVSTGRAVIGSISDRHTREMRIPNFTKTFGKTPYIEVALGIENILTVGRIDVFWRLTHNEIGVKTNDISNFGLRARYAFNF
jgi:hypothetical protein